LNDPRIGWFHTAEEDNEGSQGAGDTAEALAGRTHNIADFVVRLEHAEQDAGRASGMSCLGLLKQAQCGLDLSYSSSSGESSVHLFDVHILILLNRSAKHGDRFGD